MNPLKLAKQILSNSKNDSTLKVPFITNSPRNLRVSSLNYDTSDNRNFKVCIRVRPPLKREYKDLEKFKSIVI